MFNLETPGLVFIPHEILPEVINLAILVKDTQAFTTLIASTTIELDERIVEINCTGTF